MKENEKVTFFLEKHEGVSLGHVDKQKMLRVFLVLLKIENGEVLSCFI